MKNIKSQTIIPRGAVQLFNGEAAHCGDADEVVNLRERDDSLAAVGVPAAVGTIPADHRLIFADGDFRLTLHGVQVFHEGTLLATLDGDFLDARAVGDVIVIATLGGMHYLRRSGDTCTVLDPSRAIPVINIDEAEATTVSVSLEAYEFASPYSQWQPPLATADIQALSTMLATAVTRAQNTAAADAIFTRPMLARYAVRMHDDSVLWVSQPVLLGGATLANPRHRVAPATSGGAYTGIPASTFTLPAYRLGITVLGGIGEEWLPMVKSVDIYVTADVPTRWQNGALDYRCSTSISGGVREQWLEMTLPSRSVAAVSEALLGSQWRLVASTTQLSALRQKRFESGNVRRSPQQWVSGIDRWTLVQSALAAATLTHAQCSAVHRRISVRRAPTCLLSHNRRLYTGGGTATLRLPWNVQGWWAGTAQAMTCVATVAVTLATNHGAAVVTHSEALGFTPSALNALLAYPDPRATSMTITVTSSGITRSWQGQLTPHHEAGMAWALSADLAPNALATVTDPPQAQSANLVDDRSGAIDISLGSNVWVTERELPDVADGITALAIATRPVYAGGFGRHPLYVFGGEGVLALPRRSDGTVAEARLISRAVIAQGTLPVEGDDRVWWHTADRRLCSVEGAKVTVHLRDIDITSMGWNDVERELWLVTPSGARVVMLSGRTAARTFAPVRLLGCWATDENGTVYDLRCENAATLPVFYRSQPIHLHPEISSVPMGVNPALTRVPAAVVWNVNGADLDLRLAVNGERGASCHGFLIAALNVQGNVDAPLVQRLVAQPCRTIRLEAEGNIPTGTLILPIVIKTAERNVNF